MFANPYWAIAGFYFCYYAFIGAFAPYWSLYLQSLQFEVMDIALLMTVQPVMRMIAPTLWGWLADHTGKRLQVIQLAAALSALTYLGVFFTTSFWGLLLAMALMSFFWSASMPLVEATTLSYLGKQSASYGRIRSWGSIGFIVTVVGLGYLFDYVLISWLLFAILLCEIGIYLFSRALPDTQNQQQNTEPTPLSGVMGQSAVILLFAACFLMTVAHAPYYTFFSIYLVEHGYSKAAVGGLWALGVICEILVFLMMPWLVQRFGYSRILAAALLLAVLRFSLIGWCVDQLALLLLAQMLHAATFGAYHAASIGLIHQLFQGRLQARGQALFGSITYGAGNVIGTLASGGIWEQYGATMLYSGSALMALLGWLLLQPALRRLPN